MMVRGCLIKAPILLVVVILLDCCQQLNAQRTQLHWYQQLLTSCPLKCWRSHDTNASLDADTLVLTGAASMPIRSPLVVWSQSQVSYIPISRSWPAKLQRAVWRMCGEDTVLSRASQQMVNIDQYVALDRGASMTLLIPSSGAATSWSPSQMKSTTQPTLCFSYNPAEVWWFSFGVSTVVDGDNLTSPYDTLVTRKWMFIDPGSSSVEEMIQSTHTFPINVQQ